MLGSCGLFRIVLCVEKGGCAFCTMMVGGVCVFWGGGCDGSYGCGVVVVWGVVMVVHWWGCVVLISRLRVLIIIIA